MILYSWDKVRHLIDGRLQRQGLSTPSSALIREGVNQGANGCPSLVDVALRALRIVPAKRNLQQAGLQGQPRAVSSTKKALVPYLP